MAKRSSGVRRICLVGATGLIGTSLIEASMHRKDVRLIAVARRELQLPPGARMEVLLAPTEGWPEAIAASNADVFVCALGTTMKNVGGDREAFRAVDHDLVIASAKAAHDAGIGHMILVSSVGADSGSGNFYLRNKGEAETQVRKLGFERLDILQPSLLVGKRQESRPLERLAVLFAPLMNLVLHGKARRFRAIRTSNLAQTILALAHEKRAGRFVLEYDAMRYAARRFDQDREGRRRSNRPGISQANGPHRPIAMLWKVSGSPGRRRCNPASPFGQVRGKALRLP
jgi:uncharacterized protein YbjT (DUF2867 family)